MDRLLLEEKRIPYTVRKTPLNSYKVGEKPSDFVARVPNGLVPDLTLDMDTPHELTMAPKEYNRVAQTLTSGHPARLL